MLEIQRASFIVHLLCNLHCRDCCVRVVEYRNPYNPNLEFLAASMDKLFSIVDKINYFSVEGGEPMIYRDLPAVMSHLLRYKDKIGVEAPLITNGGFLFSKELLEVLKEFGDKGFVIIDNYGEDKSPKVNKIIDQMVANGTRWQVKDYSQNFYYGGWVNLYGNYEKKHSESDAVLLHAKCAWSNKLKGVVEVVGGLLMFCPPVRMLRERGVDTSNGWIDMFDDATTTEQKRNAIRKWYTIDAFTACQYCNGIHDDSERIPPAIQLTREELKKIKTNDFIYKENLHR